MAVLPGSAIVGTVGGGCGEARVIECAQQVLQGRPARVVEIDLTGDPDQDEAPICGGRMEVLIEPWQPADLVDAERIAAAEARREEVAVVTVATSRAQGWSPGQRTLCLAGSEHECARRLGLSGKAAVVLGQTLARREYRVYAVGSDGMITAERSTGGAEPIAAELFFAPCLAAPVLAIVGAGHIAQALCEITFAAGFAVTVLDDRAAFANPERFPRAERVVADDYPGVLGLLPRGRNAFVVIATRGHQYDEVALRHVLGRAEMPQYVGMVASRRRAKTTRARLEAHGIDRARLAAVHMPVGCDIGAETPAEIAIAIAAEMITELRRGQPRPPGERGQ